MIEIYKIRDKETGLFSAGGSYPSWTKKGKIWKRKSDLLNHINLATISRYRNAEVVCYQLVETEMSVGSIQDLIDASKERKRKKEERSRSLARKWQEEQELRELERLKAKYPERFSR